MYSYYYGKHDIQFGNNIQKSGGGIISVQSLFPKPSYRGSNKCVELQTEFEAVCTMKIVVSGAGAAGIACAKMYRLLGANHLRIIFDHLSIFH